MYRFLRNRALPALAGLILALPASALRELRTDRPDQTESPFTVDAGHWQVEADIVTASFDRDGYVRTTTWSVAPVNLKYGVTDRIDIQLMLEPCLSSRVEDRLAGTTSRASGLGDVTTRLKVNFRGNDGGRTAFGLLPFVKWPLPASGLRNGKLEGGLILPLAVTLPAGWDLGAMTEIDFVSDGAGGRDTEWVNSITFGHDLAGKWGGYVELVAVTSTAPGQEWQGQFDVGFTCALAEDLQLDFGCNFGLTKSAPDYQPFAGVSRRF